MVLEEFTSIAVWVFMAFLVVNVSVIWFATSDTFTENSSLQIAGITPVDTFGVDDLNTAADAYYNDECATATASDPQFSGCVIQGLSNTIGSLTTLPGKLLGSLWTLLTAWYYLLIAILGGVPGGTLFIGILVPFFGIIEFAAIFVITMQIAGIIRGGS